jgi:signal transduction histidine kinase
MYLDVGKPDSAMILFEKAHKEYTNLGIAKHLVLIKNNIARAMLKLDQVDDARAILFESIAISDSSGNKRLKADALNLLGEAEIMRNNYRRAIEYLTEAADINSELQRKEKLADDFFHLSIANENAGNYKEALFYHKRYSELQDSIHISDINRKILNYKLRYELEKNDRELQAKQFEVDRQTVLTNLLFGSIGALMIIIIVIGIINRKRLSANKSLQEQNDKISKQNNEINRQKQLLEEQQEELRVINEELEKANEELKSLNITKDKFFSIVSHDLKNPFQALLGYTKMLDIEYEDMDDDQRQSIIRILFDISQRSFRLVDNLLNWSRTQLNRVYMNPANLQLQKNIRFVEEALKTAFESKNITFTNDVANDTEVYADKDALNLILRNLIANAIKFTPQNGKITVGSRSSNGYIEISVSDTGIGIPGEIQKDLFNLDRNMNTKGTEDEEGTGLGLILCKEFVERSGGEIRVESQQGKGTTFSFTLPENMYEK